MFKINLHLCLFLMLNYFLYVASVNYIPYYNEQHHHQLQTANSDNNNNKDGYNAQQQPALNDYSGYQQNLQGNSNYPQLYRYYYTPAYQRQQPTQLWSGSPIVVEDNIQQHQQQQQQQQTRQSSSTNIPPPTFYQQHSTGSINRNTELLPFLHRNSKVLPPTFYSAQPTTTPHTAHFNYDNNSNNNNNNKNIVYHRDFRQQIDAIPESQRTQQQNIVSWNNQQQQQQQQQHLLEQQRLQNVYATNTNSRYNGISNDVPDYREHFKRYLENNPHRIEPIY